MLKETTGVSVSFAANIIVKHSRICSEVAQHEICALMSQSYTGLDFQSLLSGSCDVTRYGVGSRPSDSGPR